MKGVIVGIDVGTYAVRVVVVQKEKDTGLIKVIGTGHAESRGLRHGYITNKTQATSSIKEALNDAANKTGFKIKRAYISIGGVSLSSEYATGGSIVTRADKEVTILDIQNALNESESTLELPNKKILHRIPVSFKLDGKEVLGRPEGMKGIKLEVKSLFVTCLSQHLEDLVGAVTDAGVEVLDAIAGPIALAETILSDKQKNVGSAIVDIGAETVSVIAYENNVPITLHVFSMGSMYITKDIALGFKIPFDEAERIKTGSLIADYPKKKMEEIIHARCEEIFDLVDGHLKKIKRSGLLPGGVIVTGGGSPYPFIEDLGKEILRLPTKMANQEIWTNENIKLKDASWLVALGLTITNTLDSFESFDEKTGVSGFFDQFKKMWKSMIEQLLP
jgi:cell division protein FtsA